MLNDNVDLIDEINKLKMEKHSLAQKVKEKGYTIQELLVD